MAIIRKYDLHRMLGWLVWAVVFYTVAIHLRNAGIEPQLQVLAWKLGNMTSSAYAGYWLDRRAFSRVDSGTCSTGQLRRAIIMAAAMVTVGLGL